MPTYIHAYTVQPGDLTIDFTRGSTTDRTRNLTRNFTRGPECPQFPATSPSEYSVRHSIRMILDVCVLCVCLQMLRSVQMPRSMLRSMLRSLHRYSDQCTNVKISVCVCFCVCVWVCVWVCVCVSVCVCVCLCVRMQMRDCDTLAEHKHNTHRHT